MTCFKHATWLCRRANKVGARTDPCLTIVVTSKSSDRSPLCSTMHLIPVCSCCIILKNLPGQSSFFKIIHVSGSTWSKAFSISTKHMKSGWCCFTLFSCKRHIVNMQSAGSLLTKYMQLNVMCWLVSDAMIVSSFRDPSGCCQVFHLNLYVYRICRVRRQVISLYWEEFSVQLF